MRESITKEVKKKFLDDVLLNHDMIQESASEDKTFRHEAALKWQIRAFIEWQRSPCIEHQHGKITHEECTICRRICWESLK